MSDEYNAAMKRLIEFGTAAAALAEVSTDRDQRIWEAHQAGISKMEIHRVTGLSWATVDRAVREMKGKAGTDDESEGQSDDAQH